MSTITNRCTTQSNEATFVVLEFTLKFDLIITESPWSDRAVGVGLLEKTLEETKNKLIEQLMDLHKVNCSLEKSLQAVLQLYCCIQQLFLECGDSDDQSYFSQWAAHAAVGPALVPKHSQVDGSSSLSSLSQQQTEQATTCESVMLMSLLGHFCWSKPG